MKSILNIRIVGYLIIFCLCNFMLSCFPAKDSTGLGNKIEYTKNAVIPQYEGLQLAVFTKPKDYKMNVDQGERLIKMCSNLSDVSGRGNELRLNEEQKSENERWYINPRDPSAIVNFNMQNGDFTFNTGMRAYTDKRSTPGLQKAERAVEQAKSYLAKLEILYNRDELVTAHIGGLNMSTHDAENNKAVYEKFTTVRFDRQLDKIPVYGHSRIIVQMAEEGKLNSLIRQWTPLNKLTTKKEEILTSPDFKKQLEQAILSENTDAQKIRLESLDLVYYDDGLGRIEPAVHVTGKTVHALKSRDGSTTSQEFSYDTVVPLLKSPGVRYPFNHSNLEKRPNQINETGKSEPGRKSEDDLNK